MLDGTNLVGGCDLQYQAIQGFINKPFKLHQRSTCSQCRACSPSVLCYPGQLAQGILQLQFLGGLHKVHCNASIRWWWQHELQLLAPAPGYWYTSCSWANTLLITTCICPLSSSHEFRRSPQITDPMPSLQETSLESIKIFNVQPATLPCMNLTPSAWSYPYPNSL